MKNKSCKRRLKNYLINREVQLKIMMTNMLYMLLIFLLTLTVLFSPMFFDIFLSDDTDIQFKAAQTLLTLMQRLLPSVVLMFVIIFIHQMVITHRVCGPLVNLTHTFGRIAEGDLTRKVIIRKTDYLKKESEKVNEMIDSLLGSVSRLKTNHHKLMSVMQETILKETLDGVKDQDTRRRLEEIFLVVKREAQLIEKNLSTFRIEGNHKSGRDSAGGSPTSFC